MASAVAQQLIQSTAKVRNAVSALVFGPPVAHVYNPLQYAWNLHREYLARYGASRKQVLFLGMNPGPFGMAQTGIPFGEVAAVRDWLGIGGELTELPRQHPRRPILGLVCPRSEVSGRRLWGLFASRFGSAECFFQDHFVVNYCPLLFLESGGCNRTPDKLRASESEALRHACDEYLREMVHILEPRWVVGVGRFAADRAAGICGEGPAKVASILHPSPASPASNRDWEGKVTRQLESLRIWAPRPGYRCTVKTTS